MTSSVLPAGSAALGSCRIQRTTRAASDAEQRQLQQGTSVQVNRAHRRKGALQRELLNCLRAEGHPMTPRAVHARMDGAPAYTTIQTVLARLHGRGLLDRQRCGRGHAYRLPEAPDSIPARLTARRMAELLPAGQTRTATLAAFVAALPQRDALMLSRLVLSRRRARGSAPS